eukprot:2226774-Lingulodinium_polyedra.AAC.1
MLGVFANSKSKLAKGRGSRHFKEELVALVTDKLLEVMPDRDSLAVAATDEMLKSVYTPAVFAL